MTRVLVAFGLVMTASCGSDPADLAGDYTIALTNRDNGCGFDNWQVGNTAANIPLAVTQADSSMTAIVGGGAGVYLDVVLGSRNFVGEIDGDNFEATLYGTTTGQQGNCSFTVNATLDGTLSGDVITGVLRYEAATNGNPDCAPLTGCVSYQEFNGTRPPR